MPNYCAVSGLIEMVIRPVEPTDSVEWRRMRLVEVSGHKARRIWTHASLSPTVTSRTLMPLSLSNVNL